MCTYVCDVLVCAVCVPNIKIESFENIQFVLILLVVHIFISSCYFCVYVKIL